MFNLNRLLAHRLVVSDLVDIQNYHGQMQACATLRLDKGKEVNVITSLTNEVNFPVVPRKNSELQVRSRLVCAS